MSRYIDADKIEEVIRNDVPLKYFMTSSYNVAIKNGLKIAEILTDKVPTADVKEVKHGEWITDKDGFVTCSECGEEHTWDDFRPTFCDTCGARMDGGFEE